jgi:uncharacterized membrane protein
VGAAPKKGADVRRALIVLVLLAVVSGVAQAGVGNRIATALEASGLSPQVVVFAVAMLPIVELRGAVPIGNNLFHLPLWQTLALSLAGNMLPIFLVVLLLEKLVVLLSRVRIFRRFFEWLYERTRRRSGIIQRYEFWGLVIFVGVPLPGTGAWTGSLAAVLLGMSYWRSLLACFVGVLIAATIVTTLSLLGVWGAVIAAAVLIGLAAQAVLRRRRSGSV